MKKTGKALGAGAALAATAAAAALGAYFLYGKDATKNRKKVKGWALKMKGEVLERLEQASDVSRASYEKVVDEVARNLRGVKGIESKELNSLVKDLKKHWKSMEKQFLASRKKRR